MLSSSLQEDLFSVKNKKILVTGASSGLGAHYAKVLAQAGAYVILCARRKEHLLNVAKEIEQFSPYVRILVLDILQYQDVKSQVLELYNELNGIDVLINNAGFSPKIKKPFFENDTSDWDQILDTNLKALWLLTKITAEDMYKRGITGSIINISSTVANRTRLGNPIYGIAKAGVVSLTQKIALELAKYRIRVNAIAPGFFETDINSHFLQSSQGYDLISRTVPLARVGNYDELNGALFLLASNASSYITGECLYVDGGYITNAIT